MSPISTCIDNLLSSTLAAAVRLDEGSSANEGIAMYYGKANSKWGTICDSSYSKSDWPSVLCKQMGYESCDVIDTNNSDLLQQHSTCFVLENKQFCTE